MPNTSVIEETKLIVDQITLWLHYIGSYCLLAMVFLTTIDVGMRYAFNKPLSGTYELMEYLMVILVSFALAYTASSKAHIRITVLTNILPIRVQAVIACLMDLASLSLISLVAWQSLVHTFDKFKAGTESSVLQIPVYPFIFLVTVGMGTFFLTVFMEMIMNIKLVIKK